MNELTQHIPQLLQICRRTGAQQATAQAQLHADQIEIKSDQSPVTVIDHWSDHELRKELSALQITNYFITEEGDLPEYEIRKSWDLIWMIDPLDGTQEYIAQTADWSINIALLSAQEPVLGIVYFPVTDEFYYAIKNRGAYVIQKEESSRLLQTDHDMETYRVYTSKSNLDPVTKTYLDKLPHIQQSKMPGSRKWINLAKNKAHAYPRFHQLSEWDTAANEIILCEAGGYVSDLDGNRLLYNKQDLQTKAFVAYSAIGKKKPLTYLPRA